MQKDAGLSLTETLVVIAILLVIGAIVTPTLLDALESVRDLLAMAGRVVVR